MQTVVNGEPLEGAWIEEEFSQIKSWHEQQSQVSCCERDEEFREQARQNVIGRLLLQQAAEKLDWEPTQEAVTEAIAKLHQDYGGEEAFRASVGMGEGQEALLRAQMVGNLKLDQLLNLSYQDIEEPAEETLRSFHQDHARAYTKEGRVRALHIFKSMRQAEDREGLFKECCRVRDRLVQGEDFTQVAQSFSDKPAEEIDLGFFKRGDLMDEFEYVAFSMQKGEISPVFSSYHGFHIAKVEEIEAPVVRPFEEVREEVSKDWWQEARDESLKKVIQELKAQAVIEEIEEAEDAEKVASAGSSSEDPPEPSAHGH